MLRTATRLSSKSRSLSTLRRAVEPPHDTKIPLGTWKEALFFGTALATIGGTYLYEKDPTRIQQWINTTTANIQPPIVYAEPRVSGESEDSDSTLRVDHRTTSQHWDTQPQCQLWGSNEYRIVAPDLPKDQIITKPRPLTGLQGQALIDVKLAKTHAAAIDADGHLYQWGSGFDGAEDVNAPEACRQPICTLAGQQIQRIALGASMIFAVNRRGQLLACHASRQQQQEDARYLQPGSWSVKRWWWPFSRRVEPTLGYAVVKLDQPFAGEHVVDVAAGDEHVVALTNHGRVFAATTQQLTAPTEQGGWQATLTLVPGLEREYCVEIACGRAHSVVRTKYGDAYTWGDNQFGQLGLGPFKPSQLHVTRPQLVSALRKPVHQEHGPPLPAGQVIRVAAGGNLTYFILDHGEMASICLWWRSTRSIGYRTIYASTRHTCKATFYFWPH
jgi:alpha-tubulin suppressor-like RCC1 family protein